MMRPRKWKRAEQPGPPSEVPPPLRAHFKAHNRHVIFLALGALAAALAFWALLYIFLYGLVLFLSTAIGGLDARVTPLFKEEFIASALLLCGLVFLAQRFGPQRPPRDHKAFVEHLADVLLMVPRMTLFVWSALRAYHFLDQEEMLLAWRLLQRIQKEGKISISSVPLDIPNPQKQEKILIALQLVELIDLHQTEEGLLLRLRDDKARALCRRMVRLRANRA